jgi:hypothetical protein
MNKPILVVIFLLFYGVLRAQSFEGTLNYNVEYKFDIAPEMEKMGLTKEVLIEKMKSEGKWSDSLRITYKKDKYIMYTNFSPQAWSIYLGETNKIYSFQQDDSEGICTITDASIDLEQQMTGNKPVIGKTGTVTPVNGWMCEDVKVTWKSGTYDYYYHPSSFEMDPTLYANHIYDGWAGYLNISHALPVRIVKSIKGVGTVTLTLSSYKEEKVDSMIFEIPELVPDKDLNIIKIANRELMRIKK